MSRFIATLLIMLERST